MDVGVVPDPVCDVGTYPAALDGAPSLLHVSSACSAALADGSAAHPYPTISEALTKAGAGASILIAPGTYAESLSITQDVALVGSSDPTSPEAAAVVIESTTQPAITVTAGETVTLRGLRVAGAVGAGVLVQGASVTIEGCSIDKTGVGSGDIAGSGSGVVATDDAAIILQHSAITSAAGMGMYVGSSRAIILQSTIRDSGGPGVRIDQATDLIRIEGSTIEKSTQMGVGVFSSRAIILQSVIKNTKLGANNIGDGVLVAGLSASSGPLEPSDIEMSGTEISGNARVGVLCASGTRAIILQKNTIQGNGAAASFGAGVWIQGGAGGMAGNVIEDNTISANTFVGLGVTGETQGIILQNNLVAGTLLGKTFAGSDEISVGDGIGIFAGASAQILGNTIQGNGRIGLILDNAGKATSIQKNTFADNGQYGIILQNQLFEPDTTGNSFEGNVGGETSSASGKDDLYGVHSDAFSVSGN